MKYYYNWLLLVTEQFILFTWLGLFLCDFMSSPDPVRLRRVWRCTVCGPNTSLYFCTATIVIDEGVDIHFLNSKKSLLNS